MGLVHTTEGEEVKLYETDRDDIEVSVHVYPDTGSIILTLSDETTITVDMDADGALDLADALAAAAWKMNA